MGGTQPLDDHPRDDLMARLIMALDAAPPAEVVDTAFNVLREPLGLRHLDLYLADYGEELLRPLNGSAGGAALRVTGTVPGRAYISRETMEVEGNGGPDLWIPVFRRSENIGVLAVGFSEPHPEGRRVAAAVAMMLGGVVLTGRGHSDLFEVTRGAGDLSLAAALQWELLPLPTYSDPWVSIAGRVEPAYDIGGDAFDFAANDAMIHLAVFDAMGHGIDATLLTTLTISAYRLARRRNEDVEEVASELGAAVASHTGGDSFVTGHLCSLGLDEGVLSWVNAGHPVPLLVRDHSASPLGPAEPMLPLGLGGAPPPKTEIQLQPGDIVVYYSDGVIEARSGAGEQFGMERFLDILSRHGDPQLPMLLLVRQVLHSVRQHADVGLRDDATIVALQWRGPRG